MAAQLETTFLVETYVPNLDGQAALTISLRYRNAIRELERQGVALRWLRSYALLEDETYVCIVGARASDEVVELSRRAGLDPDHVVQVVQLDPTP
jgi:hypothetical protein